MLQNRQHITTSLLLCKCSDKHEHRPNIYVQKVMGINDNKAN